MDKCESWQAPFGVVGGNWQGSTKQAACNAFAKYYSGGALHTVTVEGDSCFYVEPESAEDPTPSYTEYVPIAQYCEPSGSGGTGGQTINCDAACTVSLALVSPEVEPEKFQDMAQIGGLFAVAAIVILCLRKLYDLFDKAPHGDS